MNVISTDPWLVYAITCSVNGKRYVGITCKGVDFRWKQHVLAAKRNKRTGAFQGAILKHGGQMLGKTHTAASLAKMSAAQKGRPAWNKGREVSDEEREVLRAQFAKASAIRWADPEQRAKLSRAMKGRKMSDEARAKLSASRRRGIAERRAIADAAKKMEA
jgi:hypothetical protein